MEYRGQSAYVSAVQFSLCSLVSLLDSCADTDAALDVRVIIF